MAMTARSLPSPCRRTARRSPPAAISAPASATSRPMAMSGCSISPPARSRPCSRPPTSRSTTSPFRRTESMLAAGGGDGFVYLWQADDKSASGWTLRQEARCRFLACRQARLRRRGNPAGSDDHRQRHQALGRRQGRGNRLARRGRSAARRQRRRARRLAGRQACSPPAARTATVQLWQASDGKLVRAMPKQDFQIGALSFASRFAACRVLQLSLRRQAPLGGLEYGQRRASARL